MSFVLVLVLALLLLLLLERGRRGGGLGLGGVWRVTRLGFLVRVVAVDVPAPLAPASQERLGKGGIVEWVALCETGLCDELGQACLEQLGVEWGECYTTTGHAVLQARQGQHPVAASQVDDTSVVHRQRQALPNQVGERVK